MNEEQQIRQSIQKHFRIFDRKYRAYIYSTVSLHISLLQKKRKEKPDTKLRMKLKMRTRKEIERGEVQVQIFQTFKLFGFCGLVKGTEERGSTLENALKERAGLPQFIIKVNTYHLTNSTFCLPLHCTSQF